MNQGCTNFYKEVIGIVDDPDVNNFDNHFVNLIKEVNSESPGGISERILVDTFPLVCLTPLLWGSDQRQQFGSTGQTRSTGKPGGQRDWVYWHAHNARA